MIHFYCYNSEKKVIVSDLEPIAIKEKFGHRCEILTSINDRDAIDLITERLKRSHPRFQFVLELKKIKPVRPKRKLSEETKAKMAASHTGKKKSEETKKKISDKMKGKSNFEGKTHNYESKRLIAEKSYGNKKVAGTRWVNNPDRETEKRVRSLRDIPDGYILGRDYDSIEQLIYIFQEYRKSIKRKGSTTAPNETQSS